MLLIEAVDAELRGQPDLARAQLSHAHHLALVTPRGEAIIERYGGSLHSAIAPPYACRPIEVAVRSSTQSRAYRSPTPVGIAVFARQEATRDVDRAQELAMVEEDPRQGSQEEQDAEW